MLHVITTFLHAHCSWIILWQEGPVANASMEGACLEAENLTKGRFNGTCTATFTSVFKGLSAQVQLKIRDPDSCIMLFVVITA